MKSVFVVCLLALVCSTFAYKEASANKILNIVTTGKISELTTLCDSLSDNKYQVNQIVAAVPQFENLLFDVLNELLVITPLIKDIVPAAVAPLVEKGELLAYKAINLVKKTYKSMKLMPKESSTSHTTLNNQILDLNKSKLSLKLQVKSWPKSTSHNADLFIIQHHILLNIQVTFSFRIFVNLFIINISTDGYQQYLIQFNLLYYHNYIYSSQFYQQTLIN